MTLADSQGSANLETRFDKILDFVLEHNASDLHMTVGDPFYCRIHGELEPLQQFGVCDAELFQAILQRIVSDQQQNDLEDRGDIDGAFSNKGARFRFNAYRSFGKMALAIRKLDDQFRTLADLGLPVSLYDLCSLRDGLIILSGPTGSGKSTTLASLLDRINHSRRGHIVTIEDPIEYIHQADRCLIHQRQVGRDASDFYTALVASLRQDPDVILVGEIRDQKTIRTALHASETGHLVLTTVHASDCPSTIERMVSVFSDIEQKSIRGLIALVLKAIISQRLIVADGDAAQVNERGRRPLALVSEVLRVTPAIANLIVSARTAQMYSAMEIGQNQGMQTFEQDLARLVQTGMLSEPTALSMARNPNVLKDRMRLTANKRLVVRRKPRA